MKRSSTCLVVVFFVCTLINSVGSFSPISVPFRRNNIITSASFDTDVSTTEVASPRVLFESKLDNVLLENTLLRLQLSENKRVADSDSPIYDLKSVVGRLVEIKAGLKLQLVYKYTTNDQTKNLDISEAPAKILELIQHGFKRASFTTMNATTYELNLKRGSQGKFRTTTRESIASGTESTRGLNALNSIPGLIPAALLQHDRQKVVPIQPDAPFLKALKVTTDSGRPLTGMADKLRQIQKFVEILSGLIAKSEGISSRLSSIISHTGTSSISSSRDAASAEVGGSQEKPALRVVDMGSGLAYLTFAVHSYLSQKFTLDTIGIEARSALVQQTNQIAKDLGSDFSGLRFLQGAISDYGELDLSSTSTSTSTKVTSLQKSQALNSMDVLIALHACDTATGDAIWSGIQGDAEVIVTAPCCHKQVRNQIDRRATQLAAAAAANTAAAAAIDSTSTSTSTADRNTLSSGLSELLAHGIFREREAEMVTDTIRALLLEYAGYTTTVFEFVGGEHTAKNVMIAAVKRKTVFDEVISSSDFADSNDNDEFVGSVGLKSKAPKKVAGKKRVTKVTVVDGDANDVNAADSVDADVDVGLLSTSSRIARAEDLHREKTERKIRDVMATFGVKQHRLVDLVLGGSSTGTTTNGGTDVGTAVTADKKKAKKLVLKDSQEDSPAAAAAVTTTAAVKARKLKRIVPKSSTGADKLPFEDFIA